MVKRYYEKKIEVTVDNNTIDPPGGGMISKLENVANVAELIYASPNGKYNEYFTPLSKVKVYVGADVIPENPTFAGEVVSVTGTNLIHVKLQSFLHRAKKAEVIINDQKNFDGWEVGGVINALVNGGTYGASVWFNALDTPLTFIGGTSPEVIVTPAYRKKAGMDRLKVMRDLVKMSYDPGNYPDPPLNYILYESSGPRDGLEPILYLTKVPDLATSYPWWSFTYGDSLITSKPLVKTFGSVNIQTVIGKDEVFATFRNEQRIIVDGEHIGKTIKDISLTSKAGCYERARREVNSNLFKTATTEIQALELIDAVPGLTNVEIKDSPHIYEGYHRVKNVKINFSGKLKVTARLDNRPPTLIEQLKTYIAGD